MNIFEADEVVINDGPVRVATVKFANMDPEEQFMIVADAAGFASAQEFKQEGEAFARFLYWNSTPNFYEAMAREFAYLVAVGNQGAWDACESWEAFLDATSSGSFSLAGSGAA